MEYQNDLLISSSTKFDNKGAIGARASSPRRMEYQNDLLISSPTKGAFGARVSSPRRMEIENINNQNENDKKYGVENIQNYDNFDNDRFNIAGLELYGLERSIKEFNEENINLLVKNISYILTTKDIERQHLDELIDEIEDLLKEDIFFISKEEKIYFEKTLVAFHRENDSLMNDLERSAF
jgi:hypothetical protein